MSDNLPGQSAKWRMHLFAAAMMLAVMGHATAKDAKKLDQIAEIYTSGNVATAIPQLKSYLSVHADDDLGWTILGHAYKDVKKNAEAKKAYSEALKQNPKRVEALTGLGMLARIAKNYDEAMKRYEEAIKIDPKFGAAYSSMVTIALKRGDFKKAVSIGEKGFKLDSQDATIAANLAIAYHYNKQIEARDKMTKTAAKLGYSKEDMDVLAKLYSGELTIMD
jgi:tetratricopeptide (TPR) repeat protein